MAVVTRFASREIGLGRTQNALTHAGLLYQGGELVPAAGAAGDDEAGRVEGNLDDEPETAPSTSARTTTPSIAPATRAAPMMTGPTPRRRPR